MGYVLVNNMDDISKTVRVNELLNLYGSQLSSTQQEILENYFVYDLSMSEIADNREVSKAAVEDAIKKGLKKLETLESEMHLLEKQESVLAITKQIKNKTSDKEILKLVEDLERIID